MKTQITFLAATAALFLTVTPFAHAGTPAKAKKHVAKQTTVDYNTVTIRANKVDDAAAYGTEVGTDAPHEERNPSQHPELFQIAR